MLVQPVCGIAYLEENACSLLPPACYYVSEVTAQQSSDAQYAKCFGTLDCGLREAASVCERFCFLLFCLSCRRISVSFRLVYFPFSPPSPFSSTKAIGSTSHSVAVASARIRSAVRSVLTILRQRLGKCMN